MPARAASGTFTLGPDGRGNVIQDVTTATEAKEVPLVVALQEAYPNPFRTATTLPYEIQHAGPVTLTVYDVMGRRIRILVDAGQHPPGLHRAVWDGRDDGGSPVASGTYFYQLRVGESVTSKQAIRIK